MGYGSSRAVRVQADPEFEIDGIQLPDPSSNRGEKENNHKNGRSLKGKVLSRVFSEDYRRVKKKVYILDPRGQTVRRWNNIFLIASLVSLFVDPLFFYLPKVGDDICIHIGITQPQVVITIMRSIADIFYWIQIFVRLRTAYVAPSSRVLGRGELVIGSSNIALRYLRKGFWIDLFVALPIPQVLIWAVMPSLSDSATTNVKIIFPFIIFLQYIPRLFLLFPLSSQVVKDTGVMNETAWAGVAYNLLLYWLAGHVFGAAWYLQAVQRQEGCWRSTCELEMPSCHYGFFDCRRVEDPDRNAWFQTSNVRNLCVNLSNSSFPFGIYGPAVTTGLTSTTFLNKFFYCLWWGLLNLSSTGQNLYTSNYVQENGFTILVGAMGLTLFASLIGNMQMYFQSTSVRKEEWRIKRTDTEQWMRHRQLNQELRQSVRQYNKYKWVATRGVDEEALLKGLPSDLRRDIQRHLCYDLVRRVPLFEQMEERMLDAICERLKPALRTQGTCLVLEGDPVNAMLFIIRGNLDSYTTNGGRTGFFNSCRIGPGDFCGEELLTWALDLRTSVSLPSSTRTVNAISDVEAFALMAEDLKFLASQFQRLQSKQLGQKFRFYSHQWRTWAACAIQAAWRRYKWRKIGAELKARESQGEASDGQLDTNVPSPGSRFAMYASMLMASTGRGVNMHSGSNSGVGSSLRKPAETDSSLIKKRN